MKQIFAIIAIVFFLAGCAAHRSIKHTCNGEGEFNIEADVI
jgi:hypothetical protein